MEIKVLNKKSNQITSIEFDIPEKEKYERAAVYDVQVIKGVLKVITSGFLKDMRDVMRVYTFDFNKQKLINHETIAIGPDQGRMMIVNEYSMQPQKYILIEKQTNEFVGQLTHEYIFFNIETNQLNKFLIPDENLQILPQRISIFKSILFVPSYSDLENGLSVRRYDIEKEEWANTLTFNYAYIKENYSDIPFQDDDVPLIKLMNGKLYVIRPVDDGHATIHIGDLNTGKLLYEGKLIVNKPLEDRKGHHLSISQLGFAD